MRNKNNKKQSDDEIEIAMFPLLENIFVSLDTLMEKQQAEDEDPIYEEDDPNQGFDEFQEFDELDFNENQERQYAPDVFSDDDHDQDLGF